MTLPSLVLSSIGRLNLIFILAIFSPSNPQTYDPKAFLFSSLFICLAAALTFAAQLLVPQASDERRRKWLLHSARRDLARVLTDRDGRYLPEEAMFRDAARIGKIAAASHPHPRQDAALEATLSCFDRMAMIRLCAAKLSSLDDSRLDRIVAGAKAALAERDPRRVRRAAAEVRDAALPDGPPTREAGAMLTLAGIVMDCPAQPAPSLAEADR